MEVKTEYQEGRHFRNYSTVIKMIRRREIQKIAEGLGVPKSTIEKDWILGHLIDAIFSIDLFRKNLVFKGGTCLKKCYYHDYRFSEDLDFTSRNPHFKVSEQQINEATGIVQERTGSLTHLNAFRELRYENRLTGYEAKIKYWGPDHDPNSPPPPPERWNTSIKLEIILFEEILFPVTEQAVDHSYSDRLSSAPLLVPAYSKFEIITEKIRSLVQRSYKAPRDYFDIWYLLQDTSFPEETLREKVLLKMAIKGIVLEDVIQFFPVESNKALVTGWEQSLRHQVTGKLPDFDNVMKELRIYLEKIFR